MRHLGKRLSCIAALIGLVLLGAGCGNSESATLNFITLDNLFPVLAHDSGMMLVEGGELYEMAHQKYREAMKKADIPLDTPVITIMRRSGCFDTVTHEIQSQSGGGVTITQVTLEGTRKDADGREETSVILTFLIGAESGKKSLGEVSGAIVVNDKVRQLHSLEIPDLITDLHFSDGRGKVERWGLSRKR